MTAKAYITRAIRQGRVTVHTFRCATVKTHQKGMNEVTLQEALDKMADPHYGHFYVLCSRCHRIEASFVAAHTDPYAQPGPAEPKPVQHPQPREVEINPEERHVLSLALVQCLRTDTATGELYRWRGTDGWDKVIGEGASATLGWLADGVVGLILRGVLKVWETRTEPGPDGQPLNIIGLAAPIEAVYTD